MDKTKKTPLPETARDAPRPEPKRGDPKFVRGTIDPPTKKG